MKLSNRARHKLWWTMIDDERKIIENLIDSSIFRKRWRKHFSSHSKIRISWTSRNWFHNYIIIMCPIIGRVVQPINHRFRIFSCESDKRWLDGSFQRKKYFFWICVCVLNGNPETASLAHHYSHNIMVWRYRHDPMTGDFCFFFNIP